MYRLILLLMFLLSCGDSVTKARDISQVVDAHFEYSNLKVEHVGTSEGSRRDTFFVYTTYHVSGTIKNNSGINIPEAKFYLRLYEDDSQIEETIITIDQLLDGSKRDFSMEDFTDTLQRLSALSI